MTKRTLFCLALLLSVRGLRAQSYGGYFDSADCGTIQGWAWDGTQPNTPISVSIYDVITSTTLATVSASNYRPDLYAAGYGNGYHGFGVVTPASVKDGLSHVLVVYVAGTSFQLQPGSKTINCPSGSTGYKYYFTNPLTSVNNALWTQNGNVTTSSSGLSSTDTNGGSLISSVPVPDGTGQYEVRNIYALTTSGGTFVTYVDATSNALSGPASSGNYYAVELQNPHFDGSTCTATLALYKSVSGTVTTVGMVTIPCHNGMVLRVVRTFAGQLMVYYDNTPVMGTTDSDITTGQPGVGARNVPAGNSISRVDLGPLDRVTPNPFSPQSIGTSSFSNRVDIQWTGLVDDPNGVGVAFTQIYRNGVNINWDGLSSATFSDTGVSPSTAYSYTLWAFDYHLNATGISFNVTTPPAGSIDFRRVGVRPTGAYWGASPEQIDVLSSNLNFSLPLVKALGRNGWSATFGLTYNSQNWRQDPGGTWNLGHDVGYGYGVKLLAGSLTPYWNGYFTLDHYVFTDATGAEYRLTVNNNGVWTSTDSIYVIYDSNANKLYFRDGTYWVLGATSAGTEQDAGTMYPTIMEDTNGNQLS